MAFLELELTSTTSSSPRAITFESEENQTLPGKDETVSPSPFPDDPNESARYQVHQFHSDILPDDRAVQVYLPAQYLEQEERRFPVFYLHDGQNLFDGQTSYVAGKTWRAHTTADRLNGEEAIEPVILVGVSNTGLKRTAEYTPTRDFKMGGGEGHKYGRLLIEELKPSIDHMYRTLTGPENTGLGGSSLGGLISLYLGWERADVFGKVAVMSPSLWWDHRSIFSIINKPAPKPHPRIWLDMGLAEGGRHVRDTDLLDQMLVKRGWREGVDLAYRQVEGGTHDEQAWADRFGDVLRFLFPAR